MRNGNLYFRDTVVVFWVLTPCVNTKRRPLLEQVYQLIDIVGYDPLSNRYTILDTTPLRFTTCYLPKARAYEYVYMYVCMYTRTYVRTHAKRLICASAIQSRPLCVNIHY